MLIKLFCSDLLQKGKKSASVTVKPLLMVNKPAWLILNALEYCFFGSVFLVVSLLIFMFVHQVVCLRVSPRVLG